MSMTEKFSLLEEKVEKVIEELNRLRGDNKSLKAKNIDLKSELAQLNETVELLRRSHSDQSEAVKSRLTTVLDRLTQLESIAS